MCGGVAETRTEQSRTEGGRSAQSLNIRNCRSTTAVLIRVDYRVAALELGEGFSLFLKDTSAGWIFAGTGS